MKLTAEQRDWIMEKYKRKTYYTIINASMPLGYEQYIEILEESLTANTEPQHPCPECGSEMLSIPFLRDGWECPNCGREE